MQKITRRTLIRSTGAVIVGGSIAAVFAGCAPDSSPAPKSVLVYGGTPSGIAAAVAVARAGVAVTIVLGESPLGGMMTNGLGHSDIENSALVAGLADTYFREVGKLYSAAGPVYDFEPHIALKAFQSILGRYSIVPVEGILDRVAKSGTTVTGIVLDDGTQFNADIFIDASYEGVLLQQSAVSMTYGRESTETYGEKVAGYGYQVKPYPITAKNASGELSAGLSSSPTTLPGAADKKIMAFNYRLCLSNEPSNSIPFSKGANYDATQFDLLARSFKTSIPYTLNAVAVTPHKFDLNGGGFFDTDLVAGSWGFPTADRAGRKAIADVHRDYTMNLMYFLANDPSVPQHVRDQTNQYGLAKDEFTTTNNFPAQLYIRESLRMVGETVVTESDLVSDKVKADSIGLGTYRIDCHHVQRFIDTGGDVAVEGGIPTTSTDEVTGYQIPYSALLPNKAEATNLISSVCISASHVAWASIRVEPTFLVLGEAAGVAAALAVTSGAPLHQLKVTTLQSMLIAAGARITV
ncbi:MAG: putative secreted protein putative xanthan lyase related [Subtercola sp.]|nr:putative secreted protein putative xanthan lyase related [Subtercola sp.]